MAQAQSAAAVDALTILVNTLLANQQPLQAIKCLEAICCSSAQMPAAAAKTRLQLARLMLEHTRNISEATQHLQQAVSTAQPGLIVIKLHLHIYKKLRFPCSNYCSAKFLLNTA